MIAIKTKRCLLRPFQKRDGEALVKYINNKNVAKGTRTVPYPYTKEHAKSHIEKNLTEDEKGNPNSLNLVIEYKGELIGAIGIAQREGHSAKIGYWIAEPFWDKGMMSEVVAAFVKYAFKNLGICRIYAHVISFNDGSKRVLEKSGFELEGLMKKHYKEKNKYYDGYLFAKVK